MSLAVSQRGRESALLRAIGAGPWQIRRMVATEALVTALLALPVGYGLGALVAWVWFGVLDAGHQLAALGLSATTWRARATLCGPRDQARRRLDSVRPSRRPRRLPVRPRQGGAVLGRVLHPAGRSPDSTMSVVIRDSIPCTAVVVNLQQLLPSASLMRPTAAPSTLPPWPASAMPYKPSSTSSPSSCAAAGRARAYLPVRAGGGEPRGSSQGTGDWRGVAVVGFPGVEQASTRLTGHRTHPQTWLSWRLAPHADPFLAIARLAPEALPMPGMRWARSGCRRRSGSGYPRTARVASSDTGFPPPAAPHPGRGLHLAVRHRPGAAGHARSRSIRCCGLRRCRWGA
ncbi:FtsX-like permease family protein [Streptomyces sp. NPDC048425]|uniref:FtsX-like permease family protein n=1 Tax=Streptomyces sp. NPDC048425 TaxID=3365548 RepID=UPI003711D802